MSANVAPMLKTWSHKLEKYIVVPYLALFVASAELSRYLVNSHITKDLLAPRTLLIVGLILVGLLVVLQFFTKTLELKKSDLWFLGVPVVLGLISLAGLFWTPAEFARTYLVEFWLYGLFIVLALGVVLRNKCNMNRIIVWTLVGLNVVIAIGLFEKIWDIHLPLSNLNNPYREQWALTSVFINQNHLAASLSLLLPVAVGIGFIRKGWLRWWSWGLVVAGLVILFFTGSVLGIGATILAGLTFFITAVFFSKKTARTKWITIILSAVGAVSMLALAWVIIPDSFQNRVTGAINGLQSSVNTRVQLIKNGVSIIVDHPIRGLGPAAAEGAIEEFDNTRVINLHNLFLEIGVNFGLPALALFLSWLLSLVVGLFLLAKNYMSGARWLYIGLAAALIGFWLSQAAPSTFIGVRAPFIVLGLALAIIRFKGLQFDPKNG